MDIVRNLELRSYTGHKVYKPLTTESIKARVEQQKQQIDLTWVSKPLGLKEPLTESGPRSFNNNNTQSDDDESEA